MKPRLLCLVFILPLLVASTRAAEPTAPTAAAKGYPLETYAAVGSVFAQNARLADLGWSEAQFEAFIEGVRASFKGQTRPVDARAHALHEEIGRRMQELADREVRARQEQFSTPAGIETYMKEAARRFRMERTESGLAYSLLSPGTGSRPAPEDTVVLSCRVTASDAKTDLPQLTIKQQRFKVADLMPGMAEAVQIMSAGGSAILILPPDLSYGSGEWPPGVDRGSPLLYMVVLDQVIPAS